MQMIEQKHSRIDSLTGLRLLMAVSVMLSHMGFMGEKYNAVFEYSGRAGVCFFFLLSGFGLAYSSINRNEFCVSKLSVRNNILYAVHKMKKIYGWYILIILLTLPVQFRNYYGWYGAENAVIGVIVTVIMTCTLIQSWFGVVQISHLGEDSFWFVSCLFGLYILYPVLERINKKIYESMSKRNILILMTGVACIWEMMYLLFLKIEKITFLNDLAYGTPYINIFLIIEGILLCDLYMKVKEDNKGNQIAADLFEISAFVLTLFILFGRSLVNNYLWNFMKLPIMLLLIFSFALENGFLSKMFSSKICVRGGQCAMYVYLIHIFFIRYIAIFLDKLNIYEDSTKNWINFFATIVMTFVLSYFMYLYDNRTGVKKRTNMKIKL